MPKASAQKDVISFDVRIILKYLNYISYIGFALMVIIPYTNPFNKIAVAVFTAVYTIQLTLFGIVVYFYSLISNPTTSDDLDNKKGLLAQLLNLPPRLLAIGLQFAEDVFLGCLKRVGLISRGNSFRLSGSLLTYIFVSLRKLVLFLCWSYISPEDSTSIHYKGFLAFCFASNVQQQFIIQLSETMRSKTRTPVSLATNLLSIFTWDKASKFHPSRLMDFLKFKRKFYYYISCSLYFILIVSMYKSKVELSSHPDLNIWLTILRPLQLVIILCDIQFVRTFGLELTGLNLKLFNFSEHHYLV